MEQSSLFERLGQVAASEAGGVFRNYLRGAVRRMLAEVMAAEVEELTGPKYHPTDDRTHRRSGSAVGQVLYEGRGETIKRPRVRRVHEDGSSKEVRTGLWEPRAGHRPVCRVPARSGEAA